jgi:hypothetical protein
MVCLENRRLVLHYDITIFALIGAEKIAMNDIIKKKAKTTLATKKSA